MIPCNNSLFLPRLYLHTYDIISRTQRNLVIHYHIELLLGSGIFFSSSEKLIPLSTVHHSWCNLHVGLHACRDPICTDAYVFLININVSPFRWRQQYVHMDDKKYAHFWPLNQYLGIQASLLLGLNCISTNKVLNTYIFDEMFFKISVEFSLHRCILWKSRSTQFYWLGPQWVLFALLLLSKVQTFWEEHKICAILLMLCTFTW